MGRKAQNFKVEEVRRVMGHCQKRDYRKLLCGEVFQHL
jgi:hypothetical protein